ncbi:hypothetical protein DFQ26_001922 [Actinomortierella ambigua]|nr:hypothetical protein DFQ26_001922 [Actinomortierella ambigua]
MRDAQAEDWLIAFDRYRGALGLIHQTTIANCMMLLFVGDASRWFEMIRETIDQTNPYDDLRLKFRARFVQSHDADDAFDQLRSLRQKGSAFEYTFKFQRLALRVKGLDTKTACRLLKGGLKPEIRVFVENHPSSQDLDLNSLISLVERIDRAPSQFPSGRHQPAYPRTQYSHNGPQPMELDSIRAVPAESSRSRFQGPIRSRQQQKQHDYANNLCLYCHRAGHRVASCPQKAGKARAQ